MKYLKFIYVIVGLVIAGNIHSQDSYFSQFYSSPIYLSPSLAGASEKARLNVNYRNQWPNLPKAYTTYAISFDQYIPKYKSGIGAMIIRSQDGGVLNTTNASLSYSYTIEVNREIKVRPGLKAGYYFRNIDYNSINFADEISRNASSTIELLKEEKIQHYDFSSSMLLYTSFYWLGFTADHLLALNQQFANDFTYPGIKLSVYGGAQLKLFESVLSKVDRTFSMSFLYKKQRQFQQLDLGAYYEEDPIRIGLFFRGVPAFNESAELNAIVLLAGYNFKNVKINYSYDISTSRLLASTGGAHEISISYLLKLGFIGKGSKIRAVPCPQF